MCNECGTWRGRPQSSAPSGNAPNHTTSTCGARAWAHVLRHIATLQVLVVLMWFDHTSIY